MKNELLWTLPPLLRGLTFDGQKGCFVRFVPGRHPQGRGVLTLTPEETPAAAPPLLHYKQLHGFFPQAVAVPGGCFFLSWTPGTTPAGDQAPINEGLPSTPAANSRPADNQELADNPPGSPYQPGGRFKGKIVCVTGGAQGFGAAISRAFVQEGALVFITDKNLPGAEALAAELKAQALPGDVTSEASVEEMIESILKYAGGLDVFVSNAGVVRAGGVRDQTLADFELVTAVNYHGFFLCTKYASLVMARQNAGARMLDRDYFSDIVQLNSKSGLAGSNRNGAYSGSKFGSLGLVQSFALELVEDNIKVNAVCPGNFFEGPLWMDPVNGLIVQYLKSGKIPGAKTMDDVKRHYAQRVPMRRGVHEEDVIRAVFYAVEQQFETGQAIPVTGGQVMLG
jgi:sorbitol-6-phosphate 2-dehydrogenase